MGTNKCASQSGMTAYGTRRHLYDPKNHILPPMDHSTISLQMGTNKCASQVGLPPGPPSVPPPVVSSVSPWAPPTENPTPGLAPASGPVAPLSLLQLAVCPRGSYRRALGLIFPQRTGILVS